MKDQTKKYLRIAWLAIISVSIGLYLWNYNTLNNQFIADFIKEYKEYGFAIYFSLHLARGALFWPSTPLILAGAIVFPDYPITVLLICIIGICLSSLIIFYLSDKLDFKKMFGGETTLYLKLQEKLKAKYGFLFIVGWSFFPAVPTDLVSYIAGSMKMNVFLFLAGVFIGEFILCSIYIFGAGYFIG